MQSLHIVFLSLHLKEDIIPPLSLTTQPSYISEILTAVMPNKVTSKKATQEPETGPTTKLSPLELADTLVMCGEERNTVCNTLPQWFQDCMVKHTTDQYRRTIILEWISSTTYYDDADVPLTGPLLKMVQKRVWVGREGNVRLPSFLHAMED